ncbi:MAG TPA: hypothetical protein VI636_17140 [Candidatus Angelobacter sp.]
MNQIGIVMNVGFGLILLWLLWNFGWRPYLEDNIRQKLFELRNELFLYAADGEISFSDPAYMFLRRRIEALIRFAHKINAIRLLILEAKQSATPLAEIERENQKWQSSLDDISEAAREKLTGIHSRAHVLVASHIVRGSVLLLLVSLVALPFVAIYSYLASHSRSENELKVARTMRAEKIEEQAVVDQMQEKATEAEPVVVC